MCACVCVFESGLGVNSFQTVAAAWRVRIQYLWMDIGVGTRGAPGACAPPPQPARKGASAPTARAMPVHAVIGLTMKYHIEFRE